MRLLLVLGLLTLAFQGHSQTEFNEFIIPNKQFRNSFENFLEAAKLLDVNLLYELADESYKKGLPLENFVQLFDTNWQIGEIEVLTVKSYGKVWYFVLKEKTGPEEFPSISYLIFYWQKSDQGYRYKNFPFNDSGLPEFINYPNFFIGKD